MPIKMRYNIVKSLEGLLKHLPQPFLGRAMNVAGGLFFLSSQCSFAAFGAAAEIGHSGVWECRTGVPHLWNVPSSGRQPGGTARASTEILILCVPAFCGVLCNIRKVHIPVGLPGQYLSSLFCPVLSKYSLCVQENSKKCG